jgi:dTDP-4-amino-4,6-dideoxygalactose transaminase
VRFQTPSLPEQPLIDRYFQQSRDVGWFSNFGPCVRALEERLSADLLDGMPVVSASNATVALMVAMRAVFGEPRSGTGHVLVPSFTFVGSLSAITWAGYRPCFVDIDPDDWQVDEESLADAAAAGTEIVGALLTTTFGTPLADERRASLEEVLAARRVPVVVDSAAGLGSCPPCALPGSATVYSLHATKPFAIGEGGVVASPDRAVAERVRRLTNFGFDDEHALASAIGINAKLPEILGATGLAVLDRFPGTLAGRRAAAMQLVGRLAALGLTPQRGCSGSTFQFVPVLCPDPAARRALLAASAASGVQVRTYFDPPMHRVAAFGSDPVVGSLAATDDVSARIVALPMSDGQPAADADAIVEMCASALA